MDINFTQQPPKNVHFIQQTLCVLGWSQTHAKCKHRADLHMQDDLNQRKEI